MMRLTESRLSTRVATARGLASVDGEAPLALVEEEEEATALAAAGEEEAAAAAALAEEEDVVGEPASMVESERSMRGFTDTEF